MIIKSFGTELIYCHKSFVSIFIQLFMCHINTTVKPPYPEYMEIHVMKSVRSQSFIQNLQCKNTSNSFN